MSKNKSKATSLQKVFSFSENNQPVRVEVINNEPWFVARDVLDVLGIDDTSNAINRLDNDEKLTRILYVSGQNRNVWLVNESGLYNLIFQSRKPEAKSFRKWVMSEVLPAIRKTGSYMMPHGDKRIVKIAANIELNVIPSERHVFLVTTKEMSRALNVSENALRSNKSHGNFKPEIHFIDNFEVHDDERNLKIRCTVWTKKGVIEHSGHLRTGYAKELRDWAENQDSGGGMTLPAGIPVKRNHNRLTQERLLDIMNDVCQIESAELRTRIAGKLTGGAL